MPGTVLIVDADQGFTETAQLALEARGVTVHVRDDAPIDLVRKLRPTVMMLNVELPKGASTGFSICSRIRRDRELRGTPILLTSSEASTEALKKHAASADHADDYAKKPLSVDDMLARLSRLLAAVSPDAAPNATPGAVEAHGPKNGAAPVELLAETDDGDLEESGSTDVVRAPVSAVGPPSQPRVPTQAPAPPLRAPTVSPGAPPLPSSSQSSQSQSRLPAAQPPSQPPSQPRIPTQAPGAPPPLKREPTVAPQPIATSPEELWRSVRVEDALRNALDMPEPQAPQKATPEERLAFMRQLVKFYEAKDKVFRELWVTVQQQGQELAKRTHGLALDLAARERRVDEILQDRDHTHRRLQSVETEFKTFQEEITRIFKDKDAEEQATFGRLTELEAANGKLFDDLREARERNRDHERRLQIFQDEVEALTSQKDDAEAKVLELQGTIEEVEHVRDETKARLETTETVAAERADEIERLREQVDRLTIESEQEKQALEREHAAAMEFTEQNANARIAGAEQDAAERVTTLEAQHAHELEANSAEHEKALAELKARQSQLLETLSQTHESEIDALEEERAAASAQVETLTADLKALEQQLANTAAEHEAERGALEADVEKLEQAKDAIAKELEGTAEALDAASMERDDLQKQVESTSHALIEAKEKIEALTGELDEERAANRTRVEGLESTLESERTTMRERIAELEEELDEAQTEGFERLAELEKLKKAHDKQSTRAQNFETSLKISEKALGASESRVKTLEAELASTSEKAASLEQHNLALEDQQKRLEDQLRETSSMLEEEREKRSGAEDLLLQAKSRIDALSAELSEREDELSRVSLEKAAESERLGTELSRLSLEAAELARVSEEKSAELERQSAELLDHVPKLARLEALERDVKALEATEQALLKEIDVRDERIAAQESQLEAMRASAKRAEDELAEERKRSRGFSAINEELQSRHGELMRRIVRSLDASLELLRRKQESEFDALQSIALEMSEEARAAAVTSMTQPQPSAPTKPVSTHSAATLPSSPAAPAPAATSAPASPSGLPKTQTGSMPAGLPKTQTGSMPAGLPKTQTGSMPAGLPKTQTGSMPAGLPKTQTGSMAAKKPSSRPTPVVQNPPQEIVAQEISHDLAHELSVHSSDIQPIDLLDGIPDMSTENEPPRIRTRVLDTNLQKQLDAKISERPKEQPRKRVQPPPLVPVPTQAPASGVRAGGTASQPPAPAITLDKDEPFAALVAELHAAAAEQDAAAERAATRGSKSKQTAPAPMHGFDESFAEESTTTDGPSLHAFEETMRDPQQRTETAKNHGPNEVSPWSGNTASAMRWSDQTDPEDRQFVHRDANDMDSLAEALASQPPKRGRRRPIDAPDDPDDPEDRNITEIVSLDEIK